MSDEPLVARCSKLLTVSIFEEIPSQETVVYPGSFLNATLKTNSSLPLRDVFNSIKAELKGISAVQTGGSLPSLHPLFTIPVATIDLSTVATNSTIVSFRMPETISCECRPSSVTLTPPSINLVTRDGVSRDAQESGFVVTYTLEVTAKKKGVGKAEKLVLPLQLAPKNTLAPTTLTFPDLSAAKPAWSALSSWAWSLSRQAENFPAGSGIGRAELRYHITHLTSFGTAFLRWRLALYPISGWAAGDLLDYLKSAEPADGVTVFLARKIVPLLSERQGGKEGIPGKAYKLEEKENERWEEGRKEPIIVPGELDGEDHARLEGWIELPAKRLEITRSCNGELQYLLISSLRSKKFGGAINLHKQLHRDVPPAPVSRSSDPPPRKSISSPPTNVIPLPSVNNPLPAAAAPPASEEPEVAKKPPPSTADSESPTEPSPPPTYQITMNKVEGWRKGVLEPVNNEPPKELPATDREGLKKKRSFWKLKK
ncbi:hypothetical protein T439DRAFT_322812 [Meredithblackwellia eburnea MCA 4105]